VTIISNLSIPFIGFLFQHNVHLPPRVLLSIPFIGFTCPMCSSKLIENGYRLSIPFIGFVMSLLELSLGVYLAFNSLYWVHTTIGLTLPPIGMWSFNSLYWVPIHTVCVVAVFGVKLSIPFIGFIPRSNSRHA